MDSLKFLSKECIHLLNKNKLIKPLIKIEFIRDTLSKVEIEDEVQKKMINNYIERLGIKSEEDQKKFMIKYSLTKQDFIDIAIYDTRVKLLGFEKFGHKVESYFLERKKLLDIVVYSLIRVSDRFQALELFQRILEEEEDFGDLAYKYSEGLEKKTRGIIGPAPLAQASPALVKLLSNSKIGQVQAPIFVENYSIIIRLESYDSAKLDDYLREKLVIELFNQWIETEVNTIYKNFINESVIKLDQGEES